jgi:hypothetical protein
MVAEVDVIADIANFVGPGLVRLLAVHRHPLGAVGSVKVPDESPTPLEIVIAHVTVVLPFSTTRTAPKPDAMIGAVPEKVRAEFPRAMSPPNLLVPLFTQNA